MRTLKNGFVMGRALAAGALLAGCGLVNSNILNTNIALQQQVYTQNFGSGNPAVPTVSCANDPAICSTAAQLANISYMGVSNVMGICDTSTQDCDVQGTVVLSQQVSLASEPNFPTSAVSVLQAVTLGYGIAQNTLTIGIPEMTVYVGPTGSTSPSSAGVAEVGTIPAIPAGTTSADSSASIQVTNGSPAWNILLNSVKDPQVPFVVILSTTPTIKARESPNGAITLHVNPVLTVGLPQ